VPSDNTCDHVCEEPGECRLYRHSRPPGAAPTAIAMGLDRPDYAYDASSPSPVAPDRILGMARTTNKGMSRSTDPARPAQPRSAPGRGLARATAAVRSLPRPGSGVGFRRVYSGGCGGPRRISHK
jgi:hypothetical protein